MEEKQTLLTKNEFFNDYVVGDKLSIHHDGEREVYEAVDPQGKKVVLTLFDVKSQRYAVKGCSRRRQPDFIYEVGCLQKLSEFDAVPDILDSGVTTVRRRRLGWIAQKFVEGETLEEAMRSNKIKAGDIFSVLSSLVEPLEGIHHMTHGGGHFNICPSNIIVSFDEDELSDVHLVGFSNIGPATGGNINFDSMLLDRRFMAPETMMGIFSHRTDIYSLGMILLTMIAGYPETVGSKKIEYSVNSSGKLEQDFSPVDYWKSIWKHAEDDVTTPIKIFLLRATSTAPGRRYTSVSNMMEFLQKVVKRTLKEDSGSDDGHAVSTPATQKLTPQPACALNGGAKAVAARGKVETVAEKPGKKGGFDEVAGMADLKALLRRDFIRIVRNPKVASAYGIRPSNCTLLYGPQGCGKTFIAEKAAQESGLKYRVVNPSDLGSIYIHGTQGKIAELFDEAEKKGPMILIFDEFDALVPQRDSDNNSNQANEVNEMLTQLNNCAARGVYVLATTNRPSLLDPAIMRKGRVDRTVFVSLPDKEARAELFRLEIGKRPAADMDYEVLASATDNYTCADITFIVEETARKCFEETLDSSAEEPFPLTMDRMMEVIRDTRPSVTEAQRKEYLELRRHMESRDSTDGMRRVGFALQ